MTYGSMISPNPGHAYNYNPTLLYRALNIGTMLSINYLNYAIIATCHGLGIISSNLQVRKLRLTQ